MDHHHGAALAEETQMKPASLDTLTDYALKRCLSLLGRSDVVKISSGEALETCVLVRDVLKQRRARATRNRKLGLIR
jgi:hypothetical protein